MKGIENRNWCGISTSTLILMDAIYEKPTAYKKKLAIRILIANSKLMI